MDYNQLLPRGQQTLSLIHVLIHFNQIKSIKIFSYYTMSNFSENTFVNVTVCVCVFLIQTIPTRLYRVPLFPNARGLRRGHSETGEIFSNRFQMIQIASVKGH